MKDTILIFGDICPDNNYRTKFDNGDVALSSEILAMIKSAELTVANLECPATASTYPIAKCGPNLKAQLGDISLLAESGFSALSLANNHIMDYGAHAVLETIAECDRCGLKWFGAGTDSLTARKPLVMNLKEKKIAFVSFAEEEFNIASNKTPGANLFDPYQSLQEIRTVKDSVDYLIVLYHGGIENYSYPSPLLQKKCRSMVEFGADLVLCQHSHYIGTWEKYQAGTILYGQGNAIYGFREGNNKWNEGLIVQISIDTFELEYHLMNATSNGIILAKKSVAQKRFKEMDNQSLQLNDEDFIKKNWKKFVESKRALYYPMLYGKGRLFNKINRMTKNKMINIFYKKKAQMVTMNLMRCDAHREVLISLLEEEVNGK